MQQMQLC